MKSYYASYIADWKYTPMSYWVHVEQDTMWRYAESFDPPAPKLHGEKGYIMLTIHFKGYRFVFSSKEQLNHFIDIMEQKLLPSTMELSSKRKGSYGPNGHWLSRLPAKTKPWKFREKLVAYCKTISFPEKVTN